jgi:hypothetical protein
MNDGDDNVYDYALGFEIKKVEETYTYLKSKVYTGLISIYLII